jgi:hypothetical protein
VPPYVNRNKTDLRDGRSCLGSSPFEVRYSRCRLKNPASVEGADSANAWAAESQSFGRCGVWIKTKTKANHTGGLSFHIEDWI